MMNMLNNWLYANVSYYMPRKLLYVNQTLNINMIKILGNSWINPTKNLVRGAWTKVTVDLIALGYQTLSLHFAQGSQQNSAS